MVCDFEAESYVFEKTTYKGSLTQKGKSMIRLTKFVVLLALFVCLPPLQAQNPVFPTGLYIADPSAHVWPDGKLYVYGSRDESPDYWCSWDHYVLSTSDLIHWQVTKNAFASRGPNDQVSYSDNMLYAPDCQYRNGIYYLYYCLAGGGANEGVATSPSPVGPFSNGRAMDLNGINMIDPCVFIDDDGQAYYIWGQFNAKMARLKANMIEIDTSTIRDNVVTEKEHFFHEGGYMVKRQGLYYFVYAHMGRAGMPTCIGYATGKSPMGPFRYGGVIIDNDHCDPGTWNNHGSLVEFKGQWYIFYHRSSHGGMMMRRACIEPIHFNADGSIDEVEMTSQGAAGPLDAFSRIEAERACLLYGNARLQAFASDNEMLTGMVKGDKAAYKYVDFGQGAVSCTMRIAPGIAAGKIDIALDNSWAPSIGTLQITGNGDGKTWAASSCNIKETKGVHAVWLRFSTTSGASFNVDWFQFNMKNGSN